MPPIDPATAIQSLSTEYPIALLPVRLETRFVSTGSPALKIRVYPDEIAADLHDPKLTDAELAAGKAFWAEAWLPSAEPAAWQRLGARFPTTRAAWIARVTTPTNVTSRPAGTPVFPAVEQSTATLATARSTVLPDAWVVIAYRGSKEVARATSSPIVEPLQLTFRSDLQDTDPSLISVDGLRLDPELVWTVDFQHALDAGMALVLPLQAEDVALGFDRLLVVGVKASLTPGDAATRLADLFDAHHYTRGLAVVRQGTPTNNTSGEASAYPGPEEPARTFAIERAAPLVTPGSDGSRLATAFGLSSAVFAHVDGAERTEEDSAGAMNRALWPCTLGYFLDQLLTPLLTDLQIADVRQHFFDFVRGRGPYAAFRVGRVPYGVLPVVAIQRWKGTAGTIDSGLASRLVSWKSQLLALTSGVARVGKTGDPDADLLGVLGLDASSREVRLREVIGPAQVQNMLILLGAAADADAAARTALIGSVLASAGLAGTAPRLSSLTFAPTALRIGRPLVTSEALSETAPLSANYINQLRSSSIEVMRTSVSANGAASPNPVLYHLLRQARLLELTRIAQDLAIAAGAATHDDRMDVELVKITPGTETRPTAWQRLTTPVATVTGAANVGDWLLQPSVDAERTPVRDYEAALAALAPLPTAELERLLTETLDTCSYRLDCWLTSMAARKLASMRGAAPTGIHLGAFGWVEDVRAGAESRDTSGGYIHAPTANHAATAAILRNAYMTRTGSARDQVAVDLSSRRVRTGLELIDGVRQGQPLGALLGYRFEAALHAAQLDVYIAPLRGAFPLGTDPATPPDPASERIPARSVVDGLALRAALAGQRSQDTIPWTRLPSIAVADQAAMTPCLVQLDDTIDATADLMLAESIYQVVQGNVDRASSTLAVLAGGATLTDPAIAQGPRRVTSFTQRVAIVLGAPPELPAGWNKTAPRAAAEPRLDAWLAQQLGAPSRVQCRIHSGGTATAISLADLGLCALDVLALSRVVAVTGGGELDARITAHARGALGIAVPFEIDHTRDLSSDTVTMLEILDVARLLDAVLVRARPLSASDLNDANNQTAAGDESELSARAQAAISAFTAARTALADAADDARAHGVYSGLRAAAWAAVAFGVREAVPAADDPALLADVETVLSEIDRRLASANAASDPGTALGAVFGADFFLLPTFVPANQAELAAARGYGTVLAGDPDAARRWFEGVARVRDPLANLRLATLACEAVGGGVIEVAARQLPHVAGARWIALKFDPAIAAQQPRAGTLSLVVQEAFDIAHAQTLSGLVLDDWTEAIPTATQVTSFAVHYDAPGAEAPQCVLLAVSPAPTSNWDLPTLIATVEEALDIAMLRAVDPDVLGPYALLLPTTYLAANIAGDTISTNLADHLVSEATVLAAE